MSASDLPLAATDKAVSSQNRPRGVCPGRTSAGYPFVQPHHHQTHQQQQRNSNDSTSAFNQHPRRLRVAPRTWKNGRPVGGRGDAGMAVTSAQMHMSASARKAVQALRRDLQIAARRFCVLGFGARGDGGGCVAGAGVGGSDGCWWGGWGVRRRRLFGYNFGVFVVFVVVFAVCGSLLVNGRRRRGGRGSGHSEKGAVVAYGPFTFRGDGSNVSCPLPSRGAEFVSVVRLRDAWIVARVTLLGSVVRRGGGSGLKQEGGSYVTAIVHTLLHGHLPLARVAFRLDVAVDGGGANVLASVPVACVRAKRRPFFPSRRDWLLVVSRDVAHAWRIQRRNGGSDLANDSLSHIASDVGVAVFNASAVQGGRVVHGAAWLTPWALLDDEVRFVLQRRLEYSSGPWWRTASIHPDFVPRAGVTGADMADVVNTDSEEREYEGASLVGDGVGVIAACRDRAETLSEAVASWRVADGVKEIVIVDWGSDPPLTDSLRGVLREDARVVIVRVRGVQRWILTRAYNLALRFGTRRLVLKVDCDTVVRHDFVALHPLQGVGAVHGGEAARFYAGNWRRLDTVGGPSNELHANGVLFARREDLLRVGGYDERIVTYGWDDTDIVTRLSRVGKQATIRYEAVRHLPHVASLRVRGQDGETLLGARNPLAAAVEVQRNRLLLTRVGLLGWEAGSLRMVWNVGVGEHGDVGKFVADAANVLPAVSEMVSDVDAVDVAKRAIRLILRRYGVPVLPKTISLPFYKRFADMVAFPHRFADVVLAVRGGCVARAIAMAVAKAATEGIAQEGVEGRGLKGGRRLGRGGKRVVNAPQGYDGWRLLFVWGVGSGGECACAHGDVFVAVEEAVVAVWDDKRNALPALVRSDDASRDVRRILGEFEDRAKVKNLTGDVARWWNETVADDSRREADTGKWLTMVEHVVCGFSGAPGEVDVNVREDIRVALRQTIPNARVVERVAKSMDGPDDGDVSKLFDARLLETASKTVVKVDIARNVQKRLQEVEVVRMARAWTTPVDAVAKVASAEMLIERARLVSLASIARAAWQRGEGQHAAQAVRDAVARVAQRVEPMLGGCSAASAAEYLMTFPEVAVIAAALLSARICT